MSVDCPKQSFLDEIFPQGLADKFFEAIYGGTEDGAYDIHLTCEDAGVDEVHLLFELKRRPGKCLKCSLTYGLPKVFEKHPLLNINKVASQVAQKTGLGDNIRWQLGQVQEVNDDLHVIPFDIWKAGD